MQYFERMDQNVKEQTTVHNMMSLPMFRANMRSRNPYLKKILQPVLYVMMLGRMIGFVRADLKQGVDVVVVSRETLPKYTPLYLCFLLRKLYSKAVLIWDFDDDIFEGGEISKQEARLLKRYSNKIIVTGDYLRKLLPKKEQKRTIILPTTDGGFSKMDKESLIKKRTKLLDTQVRLVWIGTKASLWNLEAVAQQLDQYAEKELHHGRQVILRVVCNQPLSVNFQYLECKNIPWSRINAERAILISHIGIMPLSENRYNLGKGGFKLIQYMASGLPVAASTVGYNTTVVGQEYGRLVDGKQMSWTQALSELAETQNWEQMARAAYTAWEKNYNIEKNLKLWQSVFAGKRQNLIAYSIIIVNWNSGSQLKECIDSIAAGELCNDKKQYCIKKVIIVDNASSDHSADFDKSIYPFECTVIINKKNMGFACACNQGSRACYARQKLDQNKQNIDYLVFLNPDTRVQQDTFKNLAEYLQKKPKYIGITGIQLEDENGTVSKTCSHFPSKLRRLCKILGITRVLPAADVLMAGWDHKTSRKVDQVMGAFFVVSRELFGKLHGFDERFFMYYEEVDFCRRAYERGYCSYYYTGARVYHKGGGTSEQVLDKRLFYILDSYLKYEKKHNGRIGLFLGSSLVAAEYFSRWVLLIAAGKKEQVADLRKAYRELLKSRTGK